jgi:cyclic beta-1,2-glucan synthetase
MSDQDVIMDPGLAVEHRQGEESGGIEATAQRLAHSHTIGKNYRQTRDLYQQINQQSEFLEEVHHEFKTTADEAISSSYAGEWILDNYYIIRRTIRQIKEDFPQSYYHQLPKLTNSEFSGYLRVYALAAEIIAHNDASLDMEYAENFIAAYQQVTPLRIGELWAIPIMFRLGFTETLIIAAGQVLRKEPPVSFNHLDGKRIHLEPDAVIAHSITSLRTIENYDWKGFFDRLSLVEQSLSDDPAGEYSLMDFESRDHYRKTIEKIALSADLQELEVARAVVRYAGSSAAVEKRQEHIGYWLIEDGRDEFRRSIGEIPKGLDRIRSWMRRHPAVTYAGGILLSTVLIIILWLVYALERGANTLQVLLVILVTMVPALTISATLLNWVLTKYRKPRRLPKIEYSKDIPPERSTIVVIPALISSEKDIDRLVSQLEIHFLQNGDPNIHFGLLTDFADSTTAHRPEDEGLIEYATQKIDRLNQRYQEMDSSSFFFFHRERRWNPSMQTWMGWERKRGKLEEFNRLILNQGETSFITKTGPLEVLPKIRYVITLDADTVLTRGSASKLIGCMSHTLNRPVFDDRTGHVSHGYTILQPRTEIRPVSANFSWFSRIYASDSGLDLYSNTVSDIYQDWFGEGIYVGKGIYDVAAFAKSLEYKVPENTLLSHDLFEGIQGRSGLVSDIILYEDFPPTYLSYIHRQHRWVRGDWQLLPWFLRTVSQIAARTTPHKFIDVWKIFDNLRRSLLAPSLLLLLIAAWFWLPGSIAGWMAFALFVPALPLVTDLIDNFVIRIRQPTQMYQRNALSNDFLRWLLSIAFLPFEALVALDAITVTFARVYITRKNLLQWVSAEKSALISLGLGKRASNIWIEMIHSLLLAVLLAVLVILFTPNVWILLLLSAWIVSPLIAFFISKPVIKKKPKLSDTEISQLNRLARRTWLFFEQFVGPEDHWLPPDHFQETPRGEAAHRTSPTNIGLMLTSTLSAHDLGYISVEELTLRIKESMSVLEQMEKYRGHLLNWYDTQSLEPLLPRYVSTVDSGNYVSSLIALKHGLSEVLHAPVVQWERWKALIVLFDILHEIMQPLMQAAPDKINRISEELTRIKEVILEFEHMPEQWGHLVRQIQAKHLPSFEQALLTLMQTDTIDIDHSSYQSLRLWSERLRNHIHYLEYEYQELAPWLFSFHEPPSIVRDTLQKKRLSQKWQQIVHFLPNEISLERLPDTIKNAQNHLLELMKEISQLELSEQTRAEVEVWSTDLSTKLSQAVEAACKIAQDIRDITTICEDWIEQTDFGFLFNPKRQIFRIGYNVTTGNRDRNYYDLLASEARIASLIAIGKRDVPQSHWLHLGRPLTKIDNHRSIMSWSGTMFEYLMPLLHSRLYDSTLLEESCYAAVKRQIQYGQEKGVPWGISESGYYRFDAQENYQYRAFGVPGLGLKRGLEEDLVITPYASLLALPIDPQAVSHNIGQLIQTNMLCDYGFYEAIDYTKRRLPLGQEKGIVKSFMSHHQGMILLSITNYLKHDVMIERFHKDVRIQSADLLLQEQVPALAPVQLSSEEETDAVSPEQPPARVEPWRVPSQTPYPQAQFLSNGSFGSMITNGGGGFLRWKEFDLTRWRADSTRDPYGIKLFFSEEESGIIWSIAGSVDQAVIETDQITFAPNRANILRTVNDLITDMEIIVSTDDDIEIRQLRITNRSDKPRTILVASYAEVILSEQARDRRHPVFNTLFIESSFDEDMQGLIFSRRRTSPQEKTIHLAHAFFLPDDRSSPLLFESDRSVLGRKGRDSDPNAWIPTCITPHGKTGPVLHPVMALGKRVEIPPQATIRLAYLTSAAPTRQKARAINLHYQDWTIIQRAIDRASNASEIELRRMGLPATAPQTIQKLLSLLLFPQPSLRASADTLSKNEKGQPSLWPYAISGDFPILLVRINNEDDLPLVAELLNAHTYLRNRGFKIDLVILNDKETGYSQEIKNQLHRLITNTGSDTWLNQRGGIFVLQLDQVQEEDLYMLLAAARVVLDGSKDSVETQLQNLFTMPTRLPGLIPVVSGEAEITNPIERPDNLLFDNGYGGFSPDGTEYQIYLQPGITPIAPWSNVIANPAFGFLITDRGGGYSWSENSGENRLSPWSNDPIFDPPGEVVYLRDEETGIVWSPMPISEEIGEPYLVRHGTGYTIFEHNRQGLAQELRLFADKEAPVKFAHLKVKNTWQRQRRVTVTYYLEWVLGVNRDEMQQYIIPSHDSESGALLARNPYNPEFGDRVAFLATSNPVHSLTTDRTEFLGQKGQYDQPEGLKRIGLSGRVETGSDPCAVLLIHLDIDPGGTGEVFFIIGQGKDQQEALSLIHQHRQQDRAEQSFQKILSFWDGVLETVQVDTPDPAMNIMLNRWLLYQNLSCRVWGRSAFYQSSGAYGFRDQLQDTMALIHAAPQVAREHILRAARHQFEEGDVLHWWHPPSGRGVRTRISDDLLWLPYVTAEYVSTTGDKSVLAEEVPFLRGKSLQRGEEERYNLWETTRETYTILEHCKRAIQKGSTRGKHGIPLIGAGDWNDGMNRVGIEGRGESIWLGWFLSATLTSFAKLLDGSGDEELAERYRKEAQELVNAIETHAWDGKWYLRGYYDDGSPLGASGNMECKIDAIAQSWSVLSQEILTERSSQAMEAVWERLIRIENQLVLLFTPPFDKSPQNPGYIKGYPPGIRENGGQYTHAATWTVWAFTKLGNGDRAWQLFNLMNPINHASSKDQAERYFVEPYVIAADIYSQKPHTGRGGWTWYTGSGGWMYRLGLEAILGFRRRGDHVIIEPCIPKEWKRYAIRYRYGQATFEFEIENPDGVNRGVVEVRIDGKTQSGNMIELIDDNSLHRVKVIMGNDRQSD